MRVYDASLVSFEARAERRIAVTRERAYDRLADLGSWSAWMPPSFRPAEDMRGRFPLSRGHRVKVRIAGVVLASLRVTTSERPRELTWTGGLQGVLAAEHRFVFEPDGEGKTRVLSVETWSGKLSGVFRSMLQPLAERVGREQLEALARSLEVS